MFGTLTVEKVISSGGTALAVAAEPVLGSAGFYLMTVTALFATAGATRWAIPGRGVVDGKMASVGQFPPLMGHRVGGRAAAGAIDNGRSRHFPFFGLRPDGIIVDRKQDCFEWFSPW